jgi:hypothetical protein
LCVRGSGPAPATGALATGPPPEGVSAEAVQQELAALSEALLLGGATGRPAAGQQLSGGALPLLPDAAAVPRLAAGSSSPTPRSRELLR